MLRRLSALFGDPASLRRRVLATGFWNIAVVGVMYPMRLGSNLILTRIMAPEAFGLIAVVTLAHTALLLLSDVGLQQSVMRDKDGENPRFLRIVFTVQAIRGLGLTAGLILLGFAIDAFGARLAAENAAYADPRLAGLLWFTSLAVLFQGLNSTNRLLAFRRMEVRRITMIELGCNAASILLTVLLTWMTESIWALAGGLVINSFLIMVMSHLLLPGPRMRFLWDGARVRELWRFGRWMIGGSVGRYLAANADRLVFAALIDKTLFGVYAIAFIWVDAGAAALQRIGGAVFIPSLRETTERGRSIAGPLTKLLTLVLALSIMIFCAEWGIALVLMDLLYEPPFNEGKAFMVIMAGHLLMAPFQQFGNVLLERGDAKSFGLIVLAAGLLAIPIIYYALLWLGIYWAVAIHVLVLGAPAFAMMAHRSCRDLRVTRIAAAMLAALMLAEMALVWVLHG